MTLVAPVDLNPREVMRHMNASFLFLDDGGDGRGLFSLTGLLIPFEQYEPARSAFYGLMMKTVFKGRSSIPFALPELHGSDLLRGYDLLRRVGDVGDELRLSVFREVVRIVVDQGIEVNRVGYRVPGGAKKTLGEFGSSVRSTVLSACLGSLLSVLDDRLASEMIIPVMDGFNQDVVNEFSRLVKNADWMRASGWQDAMSLKHTENVLGEVFYADSRHSVMLQLADLISYLRSVADRSEANYELSPFKTQLLEISRGLAASMRYEETRTLKLVSGTLRG